MKNCLVMTENEMDDVIADGKLCVIRDLEAVPSDFEEQEYKIIDGLDDLMANKYGEKDYNVGGDIWAAPILYVDITVTVLTVDFISLITEFLNNNACSHCILVTVFDVCSLFDEGTAKTYVGRILINSSIIVVESTLAKTWKEQITDK